jgi:PAS domain S-box-containing protein
MSKRVILLLKILGLIGGIELAVMFSIHRFLPPVADWIDDLLDGALLALFCVPVFYFWIFKEKQKQQNLRQAHGELEERFQALLGNELVGVYIIKDGRFVYVNEACAAIFGYAPHELLALSSFLDLVAEEDRAKVAEQVRSRQEGSRRTSRYKFTGRRFDGSRVLLSVAGSVLEAADGRMAIGMLTDVTESERQAQELQRNYESHAVIERILRASLSQGSLLEVLERCFGELFSIPWFALEPNGALFLVEEDPDVLVLKIQRGFAAEQMQACGRVPFGRCLCGRSAQSREIVHAGSADERHELGSPAQESHGHYCIPILSGGRTIGLLNVYLKADRTEDPREKDFLLAVSDIFAGIILRKRAEEQHALLATAIEQAGETVVVTDAQAKILYVNPAFTKVTGYSREEAVGQTPRLLKSGKHEDAFFKQLWQTLTSGQVWRGRITNRRKDGSFYLDETVISPVRDASGRIVSYVAVRHDVTAEVEKEEQLRQAQKMQAIGLLAGGVAHDVNNMLTLILGYNYLLQEGLKKEDPLSNFAGEIGRAVEVGASLTRQLLAVSRRQVARPKVLDLNSLVIENTRMLGRLVGAEIKMDSVLFPSLWPVFADSGQLEQVLLNLVVNARDAMPDGGKILVETSNVSLGDDGRTDPETRLAAGSYVMLCVRDTGTGMDEAVRRRLFEPFFTTKEPGRGTGLGLSTVLGIVKEHQGGVAVESAPGQGSAFRVYLPKAEGAGAALMPGRAAPELRGGRETILVMEDHADLRRLVAVALGEKGYRVLQAAKGIDALRMLQQHDGAINLILADIVLPDMSGKEVVDRLRQSRPDLKAVFMSGYGGAASTQAALAPNAVFLEKPFSPAALLGAVRETLDAA